ncbi:MAG: vWA domain-containing protein [Gammaproteobacteria bacterium]|jgi:hypothetical protein
MPLFESINFVSPVMILIVIPLLALIILGFIKSGQTGAVTYTGLEYLILKKTTTGVNRKHIRTMLLLIMVVGLGVLWANPVTYSSNPIFGSATQVTTKQFVVVFDISPSMNLVMGEVTEEKKRGLTVNDEGVSKYEVAREALFGFLEQFVGNSFGLILFSTEPFLARWPTVETQNKFLEVLDESLRRGSGSQLEAYSGLTNTDEALLLAQDVIQKSATVSVKSSAVILIADAWDDLEAVEASIKELRSNGINIYIIGTGVPEDIVEKLTKEFSDDNGFRIFHVDSQAEMAQAYYLIASIEESEFFAIDEKFETNIRWMIALFMTLFTIVVIWVLEIPLHRSRSNNMMTDRGLK